MICVSLKLKDFVGQGGLLYKDVSSYAEGAYFLMLPEGKFKVNRES